MLVDSWFLYSLLIMGFIYYLQIIVKLLYQMLFDEIIYELVLNRYFNLYYTLVIYHIKCLKIYNINRNL